MQSSDGSQETPQETEKAAEAVETPEVVDAPSDALDAFKELAEALPVSREGKRIPYTRAEKRAAKRALKRDLKRVRAEAREQAEALKEAERSEKRAAKSVRQRLKEDERELGRRYEGQRRRRRDAQGVYDAIGFDRMFRNGLCEVEEGLFSETVAFEDVSYQSAREEDQESMFRVMAGLLDYFSADTMIQYTITNTPISPDVIGQRKFFDDEEGENAELAKTFNKILNAKMREGSSNIKRDRYLTYAIPARDADTATRALARIRGDVRTALGKNRSRIEVLDGHARLALVNSMTRPGSELEFDYERDLSVGSALTTKDFVCPMTLDFRPDGSDGTWFTSDGMYCQALVMRENYASELTDRAISNILDLQMPLVVSWHMQPLDKAKALAMVKQQTNWIQAEKIKKQQQAVSQGFDWTIIPPELEDVSDENSKVLYAISHENQRIYYHTGLVYTYAKTLDELIENVDQIVRTAHSNGIELASLALRQREGLNSVLPLAHNHVEVMRDFLTSEAAIFIPFTSAELDMEGGGYYGQNQLSNNLVLCNRKKLMLPHGFVCGKSRSGKSFAIKREIMNTTLMFPDDVKFIFDVTGEYVYQARESGGIVFDFGPDTTNHLNPFDMADVAGLSRSSALAEKIDAFLAMSSALKSEGNADLSQEERSIISGAIDKVYARSEDKVPLLGDFYDELKAVKGAGREDAQRLALAYERFIKGALDFMNHESNIDYEAASLICFDFSRVPGDMLVFNMLGCLESVMQRMYVNHERGISTWLYIDEVQSLYSHPAILDFLGRLWREGAKNGLICTGMTQSASALSLAGEGAQIMDQSGFFLILQQAPTDRRFWEESLSLSEQEVSYIDETASRGSGLLIADAIRVPIYDDFPTGNRLYDLFSTSPEEYLERKERLEGKKA